MNLLEQKILILDCQTTGTSSSKDHLLEIAWAHTSALDSFPPDVQTALLRVPEESLSRRVQEITGITAADLADAEERDQVWEELHTHLLSAPDLQFALAHYAQFERPFVEKFYREREGATFPVPILCSYRIAKRLFPEAPSNNIRGLAGYLGFEFQELRRARDHVLATVSIWQRVASELHRIGLRNHSELEHWLQKKSKQLSVATNYRVDRLKRLKLPAGPGIYRMLSKKKEILYVGKATSLRNRVNSYFRGGCSGDRRKLEMLARVWDVEVEMCRSPLEAALLENEEIKKHLPHYNRALKPSSRALAFYSKDFSSVSVTQDSTHPLGPFREKSAVHQLRELALALGSGTSADEAFYEPVSESLMQAGYAVFRAGTGFNSAVPPTVRSLLAWGLCQLRIAEVNAEVENGEMDDEAEAAEAGVPDPSSVADMIRSLAMRAGEDYVRAKRLSKLLNASVTWQTADGKWRKLKIVSGRVGKIKKTGPRQEYPWAGLQIEEFDRMSVLQAELRKCSHRIEPQA